MNFEPRLRRSAIDIIEASFVRSSASGSPAPGPAATPSVASFVSTEEGNKKAMADEECSSPKEPLSTEDFKRLVPLIPTMSSLSSLCEQQFPALGTDCLPGAPFETSTSILYHCHVHDFCSSRILIRKVSASEWQVEAIDPSSGVQSPPQVKQELREEKSPSPRPARPIQTSAGSDNEPDDADHDFVFHPEPELAEERIPQPKKRQGPHHNNTQPPSYRPCPPITSEEAEEVQQTPQTDSLYSSRGMAMCAAGIHAQRIGCILRSGKSNSYLKTSAALDVMQCVNPSHSPHCPTLISLSPAADGVQSLVTYANWRGQENSQTTCTKEAGRNYTPEASKHYRCFVPGCSTAYKYYEGWQPFMAHYTGHSGSRGIKRAADTTPGGAGPRKAGRPKKNPTQAAQPFAQSPRIHTPSTALASSLGSAGYIDKTKPHSPAMSLPPDSARFDSMDAGIKRQTVSVDSTPTTSHASFVSSSLQPPAVISTAALKTWLEDKDKSGLANCREALEFLEAAGFTPTNPLFQHPLATEEFDDIMQEPSAKEHFCKLSYMMQKYIRKFVCGLSK